MTGTHQSPYVAWGLRALTVVMKGKSGAKVPFTEIIDLARLHSVNIPDDTAAACALTRFTACWGNDVAQACNELFQFLSEWRDGVVSDDAERTADLMADDFPVAASADRAPEPMPPKILATALPSPDPAAPYDWHKRSDAGLD